MPEKILIATDGSDHAKKAVGFGADLAAKYGADIVLVHVLLRDALSENLRHTAEVEYLPREGGKPLSEAIAAFPEGRFPIVHLLPERAQTPDSILQAVAEKVLSDAEKQVREHGVSKVAKQIEDGDPSKRILEVAEAVGADVIVTGARGLSDFKALVMGSVSHKVSHLSPVTCISVR
ncbi:MAG: universal stress protein [Kiloniellales bacterium]|nr:universal stress protein [Kiloniellales bacterium]